MNVEVFVRGDEQAVHLLDRLSHRFKDGTPALRGVVDTLMEAQQDRFEGRGARWKPLSKETIRIDEQQGRDPRPNVLTGALMRSLSQRGAPGQSLRVTPTSLTLGTRIYYARFMKRLGRNPAGVTRIQRKHVVHELRDLLLGDLRRR